MSYHVMLLSYWILISLIISHIFLLFSGMYFLLVHMVKPKYCIVSLVYGICVNKTHSTANYKKHYLCVLFKNIKSSHFSVCLSYAFWLQTISIQCNMYFCKQISKLFCIYSSDPTKKNVQKPTSICSMQKYLLQYFFQVNLEFSFKIASKIKS